MNVELGDGPIDAILRVGKLPACDYVLVIADDEVPLERIKTLKKKLIFAVEKPHVANWLKSEGYSAVVLPGFTASRTDRLKAALVGAVGHSLVKRGDNVVVATFHGDPGLLDGIMQLSVGEVEEDHSSLVVTAIESDLPPQLLEVLVGLALRIGQEGYEGHAVGTLFVVGDHNTVMEKSHPLTMNPFQGYSEAERNLFDAHVRDAISTFAMLDGAFVVRDDGVLLAAGRHIQVDNPARDLPLGLGARHMAAASVSKATKAVAIVVSQSSGATRVFANGEMVLEITPSGRRGEASFATEAIVAPRKRPAKKPAKTKKS